MIDWWRFRRVLRLAITPAGSFSNWISWWPQFAAVVLWLLGALGLANTKHLRIGAAWSVTLLMGGIALLFLVAAYRLQPTTESARRDYAERFLSEARWRAAILLQAPALNGGLITEWANPISNFVRLAFGPLEVDRFIAPGVPHTPGPRPGSGNVQTLLDRLVDLSNRFGTTQIRDDFDLPGWQRAFSMEAWRFRFEDEPLRKPDALEGPPTDTGPHGLQTG